MNILSKNISPKRFAVISLAALVLALYLLSDATVSTPSMNGSDAVDVRSDITVDIYGGDGAIKGDLSPDEWTGSRGDEVDMTISLPEKAPFEHTYLYFTEYNCLTSFSVDGAAYDARIGDTDDSPLYSDYLQELKDDHVMIGNIMYMIPIDDDLWGRDLTITLWPQELSSYSMDSDFLLMPASEVRFAPMIGHESAFFIFVASIVVSTFFAMVGAVGMISRRKLRPVLLVSLFILSLSSWYCGCYHLLYILFDSIRLCANMEYFALFSAPMFFTWYLREIVSSEKEKLFLNIIACGFLVFFAGAACSQMFLRIPLYSSIYVLQILIVISMTAFLVMSIRSFFVEAGEGKSPVTRFGLIFTMFFLAVQVAACRFQGIPGLPEWIRTPLRCDFAALALLVLIATMTYSLVDKSRSTALKLMKDAALKELAYMDPLTGLPNRTSITDRIDDLDENGIYVAAFMDVDGMKKTNDRFGHKVGDDLIRISGEIIKEAFEGCSGFYGRWGGDEFVAFLTDVRQAEVFRGRLRDLIRTANRTKRGNLPVPLDISVGIYIHNKNESRTPLECMEEADHLMYADKLSRKKFVPIE